MLILNDYNKMSNMHNRLADALKNAHFCCNANLSFVYIIGLLRKIIKFIIVSA